jgi:hypothetical protein
VLRPKIQSALLDETLFNRLAQVLNHQLHRSTPTVNQMLDDPVTQPLTTLRRQSTTSGKATGARVILTSSTANHVPTAAGWDTGDRLARHSAEMPICHLPTPPHLVAPLPVSPAKRHPRTTLLPARPLMRQLDWPWLRMQRVPMVQARFWILGRPTT